jgi:CspA family cold shock protein
VNENENVPFGLIFTVNQRKSSIIMAKSIVKWFDGKKGYGFIVNPDGGEDIFVHYSTIDSVYRFKFLNQDAEVDFELDQSKKRLQAKYVREISIAS